LKVRTKDIARIANVSTATVSRVLNGSPNVSEKTRQKVLMAIESLDYTPDLFAKNLAKKRYWEIGIGCTDEVFRGIESRDYQFYLKVIEGIQKYFSRKKCNFTIFSVDSKNLEENIKGKQGFLLVGGGVTKKTIDFFQSIGKPVVLVDQYIYGYEIDCVVSNGFYGEYKLIKYFLDKGYRSIAYLFDTATHFSYEQRRLGYEKAMYEKGYTPLVYPFNEKSNMLEITKRILEEHPEVEAIATCEDRVALKVIECLKALGKRVPDDVGVMGFDDIESAETSNPALTTVNVFKEEMGSLAAKRLFDLLNNEDIRPTQISLFTNIVIRDSVKL